MAKFNVDEQVKAEVSAEKTAAITEDLQHAFKRIATRVDCDEDEHTFNLSGIEAGLAVAQANLELKDKNGKYILEGEISGAPSMLFWILIGVGGLLVLISIFVLWPLFFIGLIMDGVLFMLMNKKLPEVGRSIGDTFTKVVKG